MLFERFWETISRALLDYVGYEVAEFKKKSIRTKSKEDKSSKVIGCNIYTEKDKYFGLKKQKATDFKIMN